MVYIIGSISTSPLMNNPLLQDYVEKDSRGKAGGFQFMGVAAGIIFSQAVVIQLTKGVDYMASYSIISGGMILFAIIIFYMISEP